MSEGYGEYLREETRKQRAEQFKKQELIERRLGQKLMELVALIKEHKEA